MTAVLTCLIFVCEPYAAAQVLYGSIVGNVTDPSNAPVPGATVTITNRETNQTRQATTNDAGGFSFPNVPSGIYDVKISRDGFRPFTAQHVDVTINNVTRADARLELGAVTETVTIEASAAALQTDRSEVRAEMGAQTLESLPVPPGRNYQQLFRTIPGFTQPRNAHSIPSNPSRSLQYEVNGTVSASNNVRMDGATQFNIWLPHVTAYVPALESIETVNVVTNSFDAEQGLAGGAAINVQIKSGTNDLHGSVFEYHNNNKMKAKPFFNPPGERNPKLVFNQFGGTVGGPIVRDKLFYFLSYEGTLDREFKSNLYTVPTALMRQGNMTESDRLVYDPQTGDAQGRNRQPFPGNIIPADRINPVSQKLISLMPLPTIANRFTNNYYGAANFSFDRHTVDSKVNWNISEKLTTYGRYSYLKFDTFNARALGAIGGPPIAGGNPGNGFGATHSGTFAVTYVATPTLVVDANVGVTLMDSNSVQPDIDKKLGRDFLGLPGTNGDRPFEGGWPRFAVNGFTVFGESETYMPYYRYDPQHNYQANASWLHGRHDVRFGTELSYQHLNHTQPEFYGISDIAASGGFVFNGGPTTLNAPGASSSNNWNSFGGFLLGLPTSRGRLLQVPDQYHTRTSAYSLYIRDRFQVTRNLTLNFGTRWEYFPMPVRTGGRGLERYDLGTNQMLVCGVGSVPQDCGVHTSKRLFGPRLGFAYRATETFVIRAGYGITNDP
ncbi:MAG: TonB-dependent receptor domain-containing protein, partial [Bryobacteraceae bacterium]